MNASSPELYNKANIFLGLIKYELKLDKFKNLKTRINISFSDVLTCFKTNFKINFLHCFPG